MTLCPLQPYMKSRHRHQLPRFHPRTSSQQSPPTRSSRRTLRRKTSLDSRAPSARNSQHIAGTSRSSTTPQRTIRPPASIAQRVPARPTGRSTGRPHPHEPPKGPQRSGTRPIRPHRRYPPHPVGRRHRHHQPHPRRPQTCPSRDPRSSRPSHWSRTDGGPHQTKRQGPWDRRWRRFATFSFPMPRPAVCPAKPHRVSASPVCLGHAIGYRGSGPCFNSRHRSQPHPHHPICRRHRGL